MLDDTLSRFATDLALRLHGPFSFRFVLQPVMALLYAAHDGIADARDQRPAYFWTIFSSRRDRWELLRAGAKAVARVIGLAALMDVVYQLMVLHRLYPLELVVIVALLACVPYLVIRGPVNRVARHFMARHVRTP